MNKEEILTFAQEFVLEYGPKLIGALLALIFGLWIIKVITKSFGRMLERGKIDPSLKSFLKGIAGAVLKILLFVSVFGMLGIEMTSFIAILGAIGLAIGLALSGALQNFSGGVILLLFKPFRVGDYIEAQGHSGTVREIQIFHTVLKTPNNNTIIIPNGGLSTSSMINYSAESRRRVDWKIGISYGDDFSKAEQVIRRLCDEDTRILKDPEVFVAVSELADSSVNIAVRAWVVAENYWSVFFDMNKKVYEVFDAEGLHFPFPQMDVHLDQQKEV